MDRNRQVNKVVHFLLTLLIMFAVSIAPAQALLKGGTWQELNSVTGAVNGTAPLADGAIIPLYQGSTLLDPSKTHDIEFSAMPRDFSADATSTSMRAVNSTDTEGDLFSDPPTIAWENRQPPAMGLVWADAATPDTPLSPQPVPNLTFCAQNLAGRQLVAWAQVEDETNIPALWLFTNTGVPNYATIPLLSPKVTLNIKPAVSDPVSVSGDHVDASFEASKVKVGESITLTVTTKACDGEPAINAPFVIRREDAINRQGVVNNANPVRVGNTELTTAQTEYHGVTDGQGNATVVVTQENGPGVKTRLIVSSQNYPTLTDNVDVIFTTITSPDSDKASMYGHMIESATATLNGITYTFTRPKLAAEASGADKSVVDTNETWALFDWNGADNHCNILPDAEQLVQMRHEHSTLETWTGWPVAGDAEYWSSTKDQMSGYHAAVHMNSASVVRAADSDTLLVSCVDKAQPAAHPQITLSPQGPYKAQVGESIDLTMTVVDRDTQKPLPYRYMELFIDPAKNRKGEHQDAWDNLRVTVDSEGMSASSPEHYTGVTDVNGQAHLTLKHNSGLGVETPIRIVMPDDEGGNVELSFSVIFTVVTSPDVDGANMWGHMRGVVDAGNLYKRPLLAVEASHKDGQFSENNEEWATFNSVASATAQCGVGQVPDQSSLAHLYSEHAGGQMESEHGWPTEDYFIAADSDASGTVHVNLENGDSGKFTDTPNYLTCSANEMVAVLDVYFNDDPVIKNADAKVGEQVKMNIHSRNALNGMAIGNTDFTITMANGKRRDGLTTGFTDTSNGEMQFDDVGYVAGQVYHGITDANGDATIILTQKKGVGLLTPLNIAPVDSLISTPVSRSVKFTVATRPDTHGTRTAINATLYENAAVSASIDTIFTVVTSPDVSVARMWGHMAPSLTAADGGVYQRPLLYAELSSTDNTASKQETNETWAVFHGPASEGANPARCAAGYYPAVEALDSLYSKYPSRTINTAQGWPVYYSYWSGSNSTSFSSGAKLDFYYAVDLADGSRRSENSSSSSVWQYQICARTPLPQATLITLTSPQAMDDAIQAVKAKNSESIPLLITTTDAMGNPVPYATFSLKRDAGKARNPDYNKFVATNGTNMTVTPLTGAQQQFYYATSVLTGATGADGTLALTLAEPGGIGLKNQLTANLNDTPTATSSLPVVFTVLTSPDSDKANMYGHMPETFTASNGAEFKRPLVAGEPSSEAHTDTYFETNENWIMVNSFNTGNYGGCPMNQMAAIDDFTALYNDHPSGKVATDIGLPIGKRWWAGDSLLKGSTLYWQYKDLKTGKNYSMSENPGNYYLQLCLTTSRSGLNIALSSDAWNADKSAAVAKKGETIPMTVTVTNDAGQPQAGVAVLLTREYSYSRGEVDKQYIEPGVIGEPVPFTTSPANMMLTPVAPAGTAVAFNNQNGLSTKWSGFTGDDGKLRFTLTQDKSLGLKTSVTAALANQFDEAASVDAIFTVQTSPDTPYASYWGHMPDTVQVNGVTLRRPYLKAELSAAPRDTWPFNNEFWGTNYYYQSEHVETSLTHLCGSQENIASLDDLKALQSVIGTLQWPTTSSWDYVSQDEGQSNKYYCSFNETTGQTTCTREKATTSGLGSCRVP
ncbi:exotoxin [Salmonella enterica]|nr:exotoxin [Salmonella enterica]